MERVDAELHGWPQAPYPSKDEADANYLRLLDVALRPEAPRGADRRRQPQPVHGRAGRVARRGPRRRRTGWTSRCCRAWRRRRRGRSSADAGRIVLYTPVVRDRGLRRRRRLSGAPAGGERGAGELPARAVRRRCPAGTARSSGSATAVARPASVAGGPRRTQDRAAERGRSAVARRRSRNEPDTDPSLPANRGVGAAARSAATRRPVRAPSRVRSGRGRRRIATALSRRAVVGRHPARERAAPAARLPHDALAAAAASC